MSAQTPIQIAIPSYKRPEILKSKTLALLEQYGVYPGQVTIFVANEEEKSIYQKVLDDSQYVKQLVVGVPGMGAIRNFIQHHYKENTPILNMDDDLDMIHRRVDEKNLSDITTGKEFWEFVGSGF